MLEEEVVLVDPWVTCESAAFERFGSDSGLVGILGFGEINGLGEMAGLGETSGAGGEFAKPVGFCGGFGAYWGY